MKTKTLFTTITVLLLGFVHHPVCQSASEQRLAILPFSAIGLDEPTILSTESLLRHEIEKLGAVEVLPQEKVDAALQGEICSEVPCAVEIGKKLQATEVLLCKMITLGEKVIVEYRLIDIPNQKILLIDQATASYVEDLDVVMERMAISIVRQEPLDKTAKIDLITAKETKTPRRRASRKYAGLSFGYLYPQEGYDSDDRSFSMDFRSGAEINDYSIGMQLAIRKGFAANIYGSYLFTKTDVCPYLGGAFGFHWITHNNYNYGGYWDDFGVYHETKKKKGDGFEFTANGGILAFHTYNLQLIANLAYSYTLNDYNDSAIIFTIGLLR